MRLSWKKSVQQNVDPESAHSKSPAAKGYWKRTFGTFLQEQDCAYRMGGFINYAIYIVDSEQENQKLCGAGREMLNMYDAVIRYLSRIQHDMNQSIAEESRFVSDADFA